MKHFTPGFLPAYNSLTDKHLADYFSNSRIRKHLVRAGLITRSGRIVPEKEYRHKLIQTTNQNHVQECLAQAIVHKVLEREHYHQIEVKRKQVEFEKKQRVQRCKVERCKKYEEEMIRALTPCPPTTSRSIWEQLSGPLGKHFEPCDIPSLIRPSTAPGKMQRPVRLKPIHRRSSTALPRHISPYRKSSSFLETQPYNCLANYKSLRRFTTKDIYPGLDGFSLPVTKNFRIPVPPAVPPTGAPSSTIRGRRLRPSTSSSGVEDPSRLKGSVHQSRVRMTMVYFGKLVHLSDHPSVIRDEIKVLQQHCGGENLCVYQGQLREGDVFQFLSRRHRGYPFSLTFYQNGLLVERLSSCCEYKHSKGSRIGGRNGLFGFSSMEGATPCYRCIVAMGMDRPPIPPPKKAKGDLSRKLSAASLKDEPGKESDASQVEAASDQKYERCRTPEMVLTVRKQSATSLKDENEMEADTTEEGAVSKQEYESDRSPKMDTAAIEQSAPVESNIINDYEEDFEADNESSMEETTPQEMKSQIQGEEGEACEVEEEEVYSEENRSRSVSVMSGRYNETSGETTIPSEDEEREDNTREDNQAEAAAPVSKKVKWINEETTPGIDEPASVNNSELLDSAMDSTGIEIADTGVLLGNDSPSEGKYVGDSESEIKTEDELERAKSVQEKLAEAILKVSQSSSEPEPSDTSTEEEEVPVDKAPDKENKEHLKALVEETNCEENVTNEVVEEQKVFTEAEKEEVKVSDHGDNTQEERVGEVGEDGKPTQDEARTQGDKSEEPGEAHLPVDGDVAQDDKIEDPFERSEFADVEASHSDEEKVEKGSAKPGSQHDESGQRANSREEDESSVLEPSEKVDEPEVPDIAEAEATSETMETKTESSEEQEALSREEAPETGTDKMQADSEEAQVTAENSSRLPEECGDSTAEETVDMHVEAVKTQSINDETHAERNQQLSRAEEGQDDSQEENCGVKKESVEVHETAERQNLTHLEEITEAENKAEEITGGSKVDESNQQTKNPPEGTECEEIQDEENKDEIRETEKDAKDEEDEGKVSWGEPEAKRDDKGQSSEEGSETKKVLREKDDEAGMSENSEKEKVEGNKTDEEYEDITNNSVAEEREASETTEVPEKNQDVDLDTQKMKTSSEKIAESEKVSESKAAEGTEMHQPNLAVSEAETGEREAEKQSEAGEIDAENGESSFTPEREPQEDEKNVVTSDKKRQTDEPDEEIESTEVKGVVTESGDNAEKQEDSLTDQVPETGVPESNAEEADGSLVKHDEAASRVSEPETFGAEIQEERNANEEVEEVKNENEVYNLILSNNGSDIGEVSPLSKISSAADVEETAKQKYERTSRSITDKPLETEENGEDTEEVSKVSEEGASVLLKLLDPNTDGEDVVGEENPESLAKDDNTDMVTNWIQMHQTSKFFETFVEPLEDLRDEVPDAQASNLNGEEKESAELLRPESPTKIGRISEHGDIEDSRNETQTKDNEGGLQGSEEASKKSPETNTETDPHDSGGSQEDDKENQEGNTPFTTEVETFSSSLQAERDFENQSSGNANSGPGLIVKQTATDPSFKPEQSNSQNGQGDTDDTFNDISRDGRQTTQITELTTSNSADGSQKEPHNEDVQTQMLERRFSGETRDMQIIEEIKHTLSKERQSTFSLFGHTSYPLLTTSGSDGGQ